MSSEVLRGIDPLGYLTTFFREGVFPDGRGLLDEQKLVFKQGECGGVGSSVVSTQGVTVSCTIEASVSLVSDGQLINIQIEPSQQLSEKEAEDFNNLLLPLFTNGSFILRENLRCLDVNGKALPLEWQFLITVKVLCLEGNLLDAVVCAIGAALADTKLPSIVLNHSEGDESAIEKSQIQADYGTIHKLILEEPLMCCSFGVFVDNDSKKKSEILLMTPDIEATSVCRATCSVVIGKGDRIALVRERGRITSFSLLKKMCQITAERRHKLVEALRTA
ncbi:hypothetical protein CAEBREN_23996 [Caenorhabditis brenneri]|uniref:Ribosomal RNA-processing protein 43 n=1 Tax=Caenorhabditis brenneri TaxID=135651 RepID=G0NR05_CAEBE|nr:hypothetical protein CAEBREN_23996 [Caenorhabditis brenneri]